MDGLSACLWRLWRGGRNSLRRLTIEQPLRGIAMVIVLGTVWVLLGGLFWAVMRFLEQERYHPYKDALVETLLGVFCFALFFLVMISDLVVTWAGLFRSRAAVFQAQGPIADRTLFWIAAIEGGLWSSWAVLVLALPLVGTLTAEATNPCAYAPAALLALAAFIACAVAAGTLGALVMARLIPLLRRGLPGIIALVVMGLTVGLLLLAGGLEGEKPVSVIQEVVGRLAFTANPLLPSAWAQQALVGAGNGEWGVWLHHVLLLIATAAGLGVIGETVAWRRLRLDLDAVTGRPDRTSKPRGRPWRPLPFLPTDLALLAAKDLRLFLRDPAQVLQFTMFFGLLGFYLLMLPRLGRAFLLDESWRPAVSVLNLTAIAMALATFTGRFVFPLLSLEGRRLWVLILAPFERQRVVTAKFVFALLVGLPISALLVVFSGIMLELPTGLIVYQAAVIACMALGLSAGSLGIGARLADYDEDNPGKLVAGYGGNINLLASLAYTGLLLAGAAVPLFVDLGPWVWIAAGGWTLLITGLWTTGFLRMAWHWFAFD